MLNRVGATIFSPNAHFALSSYAALETLKHKKNFELLHNLFAVDMDTAPVQIQMELKELHCNETPKAKYYTAEPAQFICPVPEAMSQLRLHVARTLWMFGSTYLYEKLFSVMKINKTADRSCLTDERLQSILRISTTKSLTPNLNKLVAKKRCQASSSDKTA